MNSPNANTTERPLGKILVDKDYLRQRIAPSIFDDDYLAFSDLYQLVGEFASKVEGRLFDYGCGGAPYQELFAKCPEYIRADVTPGPKIDRLLAPDGGTFEEANTYDVILSSQVLEHVKNPQLYVRECQRILRPGGQLLLTTHGMFQEHGCPYDFQRWTSRGLEELVSEAGFEIMESWKLTCEIRAVIQLQHHFAAHLRCPGRKFLHFVFAILRRGYRHIGLPASNLLGGIFKEHARLEASHSSSVYIGVAVRARKK